MPEHAESIPMFLYGTLRKNESHHDLIAPWLLDSVSARIWGRLYHVPAGYPALEIPEQLIIASGSESPDVDADLACHTPATRPLTVEGDWGWIKGDVVTMASPAISLPPIDAYEDFFPGKPSLFNRVLAPVSLAESTTLAWVYIRPSKPGDTRLMNGTWPPGTSFFPSS